MVLTDPKAIRQTLTDHGLSPRKYLGQHFLVSHRVLDSIIQVAELKREDTVLEIGPGLGTLTFELAKHVKKVIAVEQDKKLAELLYKNTRTQEHKNNIEVINEDILSFSLNQLQAKNYKLIANLPYQITSPVLWRFLYEEKNKPELMVIMIQKEVAERLVARPGDMTLLSVLAQYYATVEKVVQVKRTLFYPSPKVDSTVVKLRILNSQSPIDEEKFFKLVKLGFSSKRKQLKNNLSSILGEEEILLALKQIGLLTTARAQELAVEDWLKIYEMLYNDAQEHLSPPYAAN